MTLAIAHEPSHNRFVAVVEGQECVIDYHLSGSTMTITHTIVPASLGGRGIAGELTKFALESARTLGWKVLAECSYAEAYLNKHAEYADLRA